MRSIGRLLGRRWVTLAFVGAVALALLIVLWPRGTPEQKVLRVLSAIAEAVERKDVGGGLRHVSEDYHDSRGNTKLELTRLAWGGLREVGQLSVVLYGPKVTVQGREATVQVEVLVEEMKAGGPPPSIRTPVTVKLRKEGWRWQVVNAEGWQVAKDELEQG